MGKVLVFALAFVLLGCQAPMSHEGRPILLNPDGTWRYADSPVSVKSFTKAESAQAKVKGKPGFYTLWFDEAKWTAQATRVSKDNEFEFVHADGDRYAFVISERIEVPRATLKKAVMDRYKSKFRDARVTLEEVRRVNNTEVLCIEVEGTSEGIRLKWIGYLWSGRRGTLQVYAYTGQNLFEEFRPELTEFLNGLVTTEARP